MFPSSGLFSAIQCPILQHGLCERPHCFYQHATEVRNMFGTSYKSSVVDSAGDQHAYVYTVCGASVNEDTRDDCLEELDRLNKEIETVRYEVEQEQRRLSHYQTESKIAPQNLSVPKNETACKHIGGESCLLPSSTDSTKTKTRKYVVDNSKPRTDLEYDPLSNYSADLRSYSSSGKEQKHTKGQGLKRAKDPLPCDQKQQLANQTQLSTSAFSELLEDSNEDDVLIIDIPPSPERKRGRAQTLADCISCMPQNNAEDLEFKKEPVFLKPLLCTSVAEVFKVKSPRIEKNQALTDIYDKVSGFGSPTVCIEDSEAEHSKSNCFQVTATEVNAPKSESLSATTNNHWSTIKVEDEKKLLQAETTQCMLTPSVGIKNSLKPCIFPQTNSAFDSPPRATSDYAAFRQHMKQVETEKPVQNKVVNQSSSNNLVPLLGMDRQRTLVKMPGHVLDKSITNQTSCIQYQEQAKPSVHSQITEPGPSQQLLSSRDKQVITIESSSDEEDLNYLEMEMSDSDPMEECYRIFMEANNENQDIEEKSVPVEAMDLEKSEMDVKPQSLPVKKRVAHEAKHSEMVLKGRPQPQVLVPLREPTVSGFASQPSKMQQLQQKASILTTSVKFGQAFVSSACQKKPEMQSAHSCSTQAFESLQPAPLQNAYMNYIPLGTAVINMGNNLHLILPEGAFPLPVASTSSQVTPVLTPISQVHTNALTMNQGHLAPTVATIQRYRPVAPIIIPAPAREPSLTAAFGLVQSNPSTLPSQPTTAKPVPAKRKLKQQCDTAKERVPHDVRQRYVNMFTKEFIKTTAHVNDAFEKALAEERSVYSRSVNKLKYLSIAVNALKRLKNQTAVVSKEKTQVNSLRSKGNIPFNLQNIKDNDDAAFYESLTDYILTEEKLIESNYPVKHPEKPGCATLFAEHKKGIADPLKRICCRCGATYSVNRAGRHVRKEECNYHYGKGVENRVPGGMETRYSCCEGVMGAPGCQVFKLHVHDSLNLDGFVSTIPRKPTDARCPGVYSLDCEMCYTIHGLELSRVTVVNSSLQVIYDTFVRPDDVIDYNTRFSGITEEDVKTNHTPLREVQQTLLSFISAETILVGHSLETDLCALKLLHGTVVDTSVVFPHHLGPPHKLTLHNLTAEYLRRIIQESVCGHDTAEDAGACMELMLWKIKEDGKSKK